MTDDQLRDARQDARAAVEAYNALDRNQRMDANVLKERAQEFHSALSSLVDAVDRRYAGSPPEELADLAGQARTALDEFSDATQLDEPQHVRRACYVLRKETTSLLDEMEQPA